MKLKRFGMVLAVAIGFLSGPAFAAGGKNYGCFEVTAHEVNIRARPYSDAAVVATAKKGDVLVKRKMLCTLRGYWCAVRAGSTDGYVDKAYMAKTACP